MPESAAESVVVPRADTDATAAASAGLTKTDAVGTSGRELETLQPAPGICGSWQGVRGEGREMTLPAGLVEVLSRAQRVTALTGSGVSAESGIPTFRAAKTGLWARYRPEELATAAAFRRNPQLVWYWYSWRREVVAAAQPNAAHLALAEMAKLVPSFTLITQNVDGLHQRAGSDDVIELHGNITRTKCFNEDVPVPVWEHTLLVPPRCPNCGGLLRPDVVWFEEALPEKELNAAMRASESCDLFLCIGTSAVVYPAAGLPVRALASGATLVVINPDETSLSAKAHYVLRGPAGKWVPAIVDCVRSRPTPGESCG